MNHGDFSRRSKDRVSLFHPLQHLQAKWGKQGGLPSPRGDLEDSRRLILRGGSSEGVVTEEDEEEEEVDHVDEGEDGVDFEYAGKGYNDSNDEVSGGDEYDSEPVESTRGDSAGGKEPAGGGLWRGKLLEECRKHLSTPSLGESAMMLSGQRNKNGGGGGGGEREQHRQQITAGELSEHIVQSMMWADGGEEALLDLLGPGGIELCEFAVRNRDKILSERKKEMGKEVHGGEGVVLHGSDRNYDDGGGWDEEEKTRAASRFQEGQDEEEEEEDGQFGSDEEVVGVVAPQLAPGQFSGGTASARSQGAALTRSDAVRDREDDARKMNGRALGEKEATVFPPEAIWDVNRR